MEMEAMDVPFMIRKLTELYTQRELARLLEVSAMTITSWKKGWYRPSIERLTKLVELYHGAFTVSRTEERNIVSQDEASGSSASEPSGSSH